MKNLCRSFITILTLGLFIGNAWSVTLEETYKKSVSIENQERLFLENQNGHVEISSWDRDEVEIVAYKKVRSGNQETARKLMDELEIRTVITDRLIEVRTDLPNRRRSGDGLFSWILNMGDNSASVQYEIRVPSRFDLDINSTNGNLFLNDCEGKFKLNTTNGKIDAENIKAAVKCNTTNGSISMSFLDVIDDEMSFRSTNGSIKLYFPSDLDADIEAKTTNGSIRCDLPMRSRETKSRRWLSGQINRGGALLYLKTTNGSIKLYEI